MRSTERKRTLQEVDADLRASQAQLRWWLDHRHLEDADENITFIDERIRRLLNEPVRGSNSE